MNEAVKQTENRHRLEGYQKRLDATALERASNPLAAEFKVGGRDCSTVNPSHFAGTLRSRTLVRAWRVLEVGDKDQIGWHNGAPEDTHTVIVTLSLDGQDRQPYPRKTRCWNSA